MPADSSANSLTLEVERDGQVATVRCSGRLVADVSNRFYNDIKALIPGSKKIVLDLTNLTRMDSTGLGALVRLYVSARSGNCRLELINLNKQIRELLGLTNLLDVFAFIGESGVKFH
jgi:anti-sigma B factor antagonist